MKKISTHKLIPKRSLGFLSRCGGMVLFLFTGFLVHVLERAVSCIHAGDGFGKIHYQNAITYIYKSQLNQI